MIVYPFYARLRKQLPWKKILLRDGEYLLWIYVWFYLAWGLNYSQKNFYQRTEIPYTAYTPEIFQEFVDDYITQLNRSYTPVNSINQDLIREETVRIYHQLSDSLGVHRPPHEHPRVKTMLFTPFISMVGVTGSMGPFFCEFTLNGDLLPVNYPATYAHELAHLLGITSEAEANFYAYQVCTRSEAMGIRFPDIFLYWDMYWEMRKDYYRKKNTPDCLNASDRKLSNWLRITRRIGLPSIALWSVLCRIGYTIFI